MMLCSLFTRLCDQHNGCCLATIIRRENLEAIQQCSNCQQSATTMPETPTRFAIRFNEGSGYLFVKWLGNPSQGQVMLVRSVADGFLYVRKIEFPSLSYENPHSLEVRMHRNHPQIPRLYHWQDHVAHSLTVGETTSLPKATATIWQFCNGGDLSLFQSRLRTKLPPALVWHLLERLLSVLHLLHFECLISQRDLAKRNVFLHWDDHDVLPQVFLGDYGCAMPLDVGCKTAPFVWRRMKEDYGNLHDMLTLMLRPNSAGAHAEHELLHTYLHHLSTIVDRGTRPNCIESQLNVVRDRSASLIRKIRLCISSQPPSTEPLRALHQGSAQVQNTPMLGISLELMRMVYPAPMGPYQIVEVNAETCEVLEVHDDIIDGFDGFDGKHAHVALAPL